MAEPEVEPEVEVLMEKFQQLVTKPQGNMDFVVEVVALQVLAQGMGNPGQAVVCCHLLWYREW